MPTFTIRLGKRISLLRNAKKFTQNEFARLAGVSIRYLQMVEAGRTDVRLSALQAMAQGLNIELSTLLDMQSSLCNQTGIWCDGTLGKLPCALDLFPIAIQICDATGLVWLSNAKSQLLQGYSSADICGRMYIWDFLWDQEEKASLQSYLSYILREKPKPTPYTTVNRTKNAEKIPIRIHWNYILGAKGEVLGFISVLQLDVQNFDNHPDQNRKSNQRS